MATQTEVPAQPAADTTPVSIEDFIKRDLKGWSIPTQDTWDKVWYDRYAKGKNKVYAVQADFDGDATTDFAYILADSTRNFSVWAFLSKDHSYTPIKIYDIQKLPNKRLHVGLDVLPPGSYHDLNSTGSVPSTVQTKLPALHVIFFETAAKAYYYQDGAFHLIQTGD